MAEKFFEDLVAKGIPQNCDTNQWLLKRFSGTSASCTMEEFAIFYFALVKSQTDEFIKGNTSTCNTPRKMPLTELPVDQVTEYLLTDKIAVDVGASLKFLQRGGKEIINNRPGRRQLPRELFSHTNDHFPPMRTSSGRPNDSPLISNRKNGLIESSTPVTSFSTGFRSTEGTPNTPQSFRNTKNSFSLNDNSPMTFRNTSRNSLDLSSRNNSTNHRNSSSPMCLGDFINTSNTSSSGKGHKKKNTPKFSNSDFPTLGSESQVEPKTPPKKIEVKPKKRVVPITISRKSTSETSKFISSSFQSDNNLLTLSTLETDEGADILCDRKMLRDEREAISRDFTMEMEPHRNLHAIVRENFPDVATSPGNTRMTSTFKYDTSKVVMKDVLIVMAKLYSFQLDMNLIPNILSEFSYLFNLINSERDPFEHQVEGDSPGKSIVETASSLLQNLHNCIFFTVHILNCQKQNLALLDAMTLRVLIDNERIYQLANELYEHLRLIVQQKVQLESLEANKISRTNGNVRNIVFYQQETDNRDNFPSDRECLAFKKQRDLFYSILRSWELKHLDPAYDFRKDLAMKIRSLVTLMEHPINMAHLARLFTAQLIISCTFDNSANELQMVLPNVDLSKLSKLRQRLVAPSLFSTQYLFPGNQAFFRDFIMCCDQHVIFMEQLKISLISELMEINDSSMEAISITPDNDDESEKTNVQEFIVRPETMTTMRVLAKFVGFVVSRPYTFDGYRNTLVDQKQLQIRNSLHPDFDVKRVVLQAMDSRKLLVTIPWLVEYLSMLDFITLRLDYYRGLFQLLFSIHIRMNVLKDRKPLCIMPTSKFIVRACLGWLFEHPDIPEDYYSNSIVKLDLKDTDEAEQTVAPLNPYLETILNAACPFLADFRVSMMPQRTTKAVSRTGRYRHITTKFQDKACVEKTKGQDNRERLIEAFLASQTLSVRKIVDFTIDRVTSAVVKDFQVKHLLAIRKDAKAEVEQLGTNDVDVLMEKMISIFQHHLSRLQDRWNENALKNCRTRIDGAFDSLLPIETIAEVKTTLISITFDKTGQKLHEWRANNIGTIEIFSKDIQMDAQKLKENNPQNGNKRTTTSIAIDLSAEHLPSDFFKMLQTMLHHASLHPETMRECEMVQCIDMGGEVLSKQTLPLNAYRNIAFYLLQLLLQIIATRPELITKNLLTKVYSTWRHEKLSIHTSPAPESKESELNRKKVDNFIFANVISARFMVMMQRKPRRNFEVYADFIVDLIREKFITTDNVSEQSVRLYKVEWTKESLDDIAFLIQRVKCSLSPSASSESHLFMELVADLARDMDNF